MEEPGAILATNMSGVNVSGISQVANFDDGNNASMI
jgi:hypothetical protein